jgi:hypothetical protein
MNLSKKERHLLSQSLTRYQLYLLEKKQFDSFNEIDRLEKKLGITNKDLTVIKYTKVNQR